MHELAHLQRWDDWTNLAQKLVMAALFFHPGIWWIERKLSLDREMACDDTVLAQTASPRSYAQCLARVAEKSFLRRQMALAQAAVDRMKQLSQRVTRILDESRPHTTRLWKPAVPVVLAVAVLCAVWTSQAPQLVRLAGPAPSVTATSKSLSSPSTPMAAAPENEDSLTRAQIQMAALKAGPRPLAVPAVYQTPQRKPRNPKKLSQKQARAPRVQTGPESTQTNVASALSSPDAQMKAQLGDVFVVLVEEQVVSGPHITSTGVELWQVHTLELHWIVPAKPAKKEIPRKT
jgi:hypothetical protein